MNGKYRILCSLVLLVLIWRTIQYLSSVSNKQSNDVFESNAIEESNKIKISVYYEALCPDSKFFITQQLLGAYEQLQDYITVDLVPYGKAQTIEADGKVEFQCQHLEVECEANKIHACVIEYVKDPMLQLKFIGCMISNNILPIDTGEKCAQELKVDFSVIADCANGNKGTELLKHFGERTHGLHPEIAFVPTVELNGSQKLVKQSAILKNLPKTICQLLKDRAPACM